MRPNSCGTPFGVLGFRDFLNPECGSAQLRATFLDLFEVISQLSLWDDTNDWKLPQVARASGACCSPLRYAGLMQKGKVVALHLKPAEGGVTPVEELVARDGVGFEGDKCAGRRLRQALLLSTATLDEFDYTPGLLREQVTVDLPDLQMLPTGAMVQAGNVVFRIEQDCAPCGNMARYLGEEPEVFQSRLAGKRGMLATIAKGGTVRIGDEVSVLE